MNFVIFKCGTILGEIYSIYKISPYKNNTTKIFFSFINIIQLRLHIRVIEFSLPPPPLSKYQHYSLILTFSQ